MAAAGSIGAFLGLLAIANVLSFAPSLFATTHDGSAAMSRLWGLALALAACVALVIHLLIDARIT